MTDASSTTAATVAENDIKTPLLSAVGGGMTRRSSSHRFIIDKVPSPPSDAVDDVSEEAPDELHDTVTQLPGGSVPPKKHSRFQVHSAGPTPATNGSSNANGAGRAVHFSFGDEESANGSTAAQRTTSQSSSTSRGHAPPVGELRRDSSTQGYTTQNVKSFRNVETVERVPHLDHYRNILSIEGAINTRPTLAQLQGEDAQARMSIEMDRLDQANDVGGAVGADGVGDAKNGDGEGGRLEKFHPPDVFITRIKFGWIKGVLVRCILNILGVMLYLRISWVAGQAGIALGSLVVLGSSVVTTITAFSMCAICTNGEIKGGGAYFMISRSLGPEFGGSIGLIFAFANAVGAAMYVVGFAETIRDIMLENSWKIIDNDLMDIRIIGLGTCLILMGVCLIGVSFEARMQLGLLAILVISLINYLVGTFVPPTSFEQQRGITGYSLETFWANLKPDWRPDTREGGETHSFFSVFSVFFPAATGIMAGANISGDLTDPQAAIPKGTLWAILITTGIYLGTVWLTGSTVVRDASGLALGNMTVHQAAAVCAPKCEYGLMYYYQVMKLDSGWGPLITAGIFAATLSSALASLVGAPKIFQAVCKDRLFPYIHIFAKGYGVADEPRRAYVVSFAITLLMILIGNLNAIAPIISNFFLASYALLNFACFDASFAESPGFRPSFKYYNMWLSLVGSVLCIAVMFVINWWTALVTFGFISTLYVYIHYRQPDVNWGSSAQAHSYKSALQSMLKLTTTEEHVKNYRPQILVLTGNPVARAPLVDFVSNITKENSLMICGHVVLHAPPDKGTLTVQKLRKQIDPWLHKRKVKTFYCPVANKNLRMGVQALLQLAGLGKLKPNIMMLGFKSDWRTSELDAVDDYVNVITDAFDTNMGVGILRLPQGLDFSEMMKDCNLGGMDSLRLPAVETSSLPLSALNGNGSGADVAATTSVSVGGDDHTTTVQQPSVTAVHPPSTNKSTTLFVDDDTVTHRNTIGIVPQSDSSSSFAEKFPFLEHQDEMDEEEEASTATATNVDGSASSSAVVDSSTAPILANTTGDDKPSSPTKAASARSRQMSAAQKELVVSLNRFQRHVKKAVVDVWWLFDDGGLTLLVPHLLKIPKSYLEGAKLRVFTISSTKGQLEQEQRRVAALLSKFRIDYSDVFVIPDITKKPSPATITEFEQMIAPFRQSSDVVFGRQKSDVSDRSLNIGETRRSSSDQHDVITNTEIMALKDKTYRQLRTRELLMQHSRDAALIVLTMPVPRKGTCPSRLYMSWLDLLSRDLPPTLLLRGNQLSVLTFYS